VPTDAIEIAVDARRPDVRVDPIAVACAVHERFAIRKPSDIRIELMAYQLKASVLWRDAGSADARVVRAGERAYLAIARASQGTPRARFSIAHELGHHLMHHDHDAIARIHGAARSTPGEFRLELEANRFASEVLVPRALAAPMCAASAPSLDEVRKLAWAFDVSLSVAAQRWAELSPAGCAFVESKGGVIKRALRSTAFRGVAVQRRKLEEGTLALDMQRASETDADVRTRVHGSAWGSAGSKRELIEECVPLHESGAVLSWLWHA
jgi:hypothetical protein